MKGCFILDLDKNEVAIDCSIEEAIEYCNNAIAFLENKEGIQYPEALKDWNYKLKQLEQIKRG